MADHTRHGYAVLLLTYLRTYLLTHSLTYLLTYLGAMADYTRHGYAVPPLQMSFMIRGLAAMPDQVGPNLQPYHPITRSPDHPITLTS